MDILKVVLPGVALIILMIIGVLRMAENECEVKAMSFDDHRWYVVGGCMVQHRGRWLPLGNIRGFDDRG